jgi:hypothetical protein
MSDDGGATPRASGSPRAARDSKSAEVASVQAAIELVQKRMQQFDGSFLQFRCDEKGFLSICAFGLPGKTHEDGPARAIQVPRRTRCYFSYCALAVHDGLLVGSRPSVKQAVHVHNMQRRSVCHCANVISGTVFTRMQSWQIQGCQRPHVQC